MNDEQLRLRPLETHIQILESHIAEVQNRLGEAEWEAFKAQLRALAPDFQDVADVAAMEKATRRLVSLFVRNDEAKAVVAPAFAKAKATKRPDPKSIRVLNLQGIANRFYDFCRDPEGGGKSGRSASEPPRGHRHDYPQETEQSPPGEGDEHER